MSMPYVPNDQAKIFTKTSPPVLHISDIYKYKHYWDFNENHNSYHSIAAYNLKLGQLETQSLISNKHLIYSILIYLRVTLQYNVVLYNTAIIDSHLICQYNTAPGSAQLSLAQHNSVYYNL